MTTGPKRVRVNEEIEHLLEEAAIQPLIVEFKDAAYRIYAERVLHPSPYTIDTVYGSLPPLHDRPGIDVSTDKLDAIIEAGKEANLKSIVEGMNENA